MFLVLFFRFIITFAFFSCFFFPFRGRSGGLRLEPRSLSFAFSGGALLSPSTPFIISIFASVPSYFKKKNLPSTTTTATPPPACPSVRHPFLQLHSATLRPLCRYTFAEKEPTGEEEGESWWPAQFSFSLAERAEGERASRDPLEQKKSNTNSSPIQSNQSSRDSSFILFEQPFLFCWCFAAQAGRGEARERE